MLLPTEKQALLETTKHLLAGLMNERLVKIAVDEQKPTSIVTNSVYLQSNVPSGGCGRAVKVHLVSDTGLAVKGGEAMSIVRPESIVSPIILEEFGRETTSFDPVEVFQFVRPWLAGVAEEASCDKFKEELRSAAENQEVWLEMSKERHIGCLDSSMLDWEKSVIFGHPTHPLHRTCCALPPLKPVAPADIPRMQAPNLVIISVPQTDLRITGAFQELIGPLFDKLEVPHEVSGRITTLCLEQQLPMILDQFPDVTVLKTVNDYASAQASTRTLSLKPELKFPYNVKMALACQITSAIRTVTPWTACGGPFISEILEDLLPTDFWVFKEVASITGIQEDFDVARHIPCVLREDLEPRARANGETLAVAAALQQQVPSTGRTYPEILMNLNTVEERMKWFRECVSSVDIRDNKLRGFAICDFGGIKLHRPTLESQGVSLAWEVPNSGAVTDDIHYVWDIISHSLIQSHVAGLLYALGLDRHNGWAVVREELSDAVHAMQHPRAHQFHEYLTKDTMKLKGFLSMRFEGIYRSNIEKDVPNILLAP